MVATVLDIETRSVVDLKKAGAPRYAEDSSTEILCGSYKNGGDLSHGLPPFEGLILAHNALFERSVLNARTPGLNLRPDQMDCTLARACAVGLPASLDMLGKVLGAPVKKDAVGHKLMLKLCRPKGFDTDGSPRFHEGADELRALQEYCDQDVRSECAVDERLPALSERERRLWVLDQRINDRGFRVDLSAVRHALSAVAEAKRRADRKIWELTNGAVKTCNQTAKIVAWINSRGVPCESIAKGEVDEIVLRADIFDQPLVEEVIHLRRATSRMFRFDKILDQVCRDGRVKGVFQYHKAATGRWAGWTQSFPRVDSPEASQAVLDALAAFHNPAKVVDWIEVTEGPALKLLSQCLRPMVVAGPGKKLIGGDFSNIEGRVAAWFAGQQWKLDAFAAYDNETGPDLYYVMAAEILEVDIEQVDKRHRQSHGKVPELACFGRDTRVFTSNGLKAITEVTIDDLLWDGTTWVSHDGPIDQGEKTVMMIEGVLVTPDHLIRCGDQWREAREVAFNSFWRARASATGLAAWSSYHMSKAMRAALKHSWSSVTAAPSLTKSTSPISGAELRPGVRRAPEQHVRLPSSGGSDTLQWSQTIRIDGVSATEFPPVTTAVITPKIVATAITEAAASLCTRLGEKIAQHSFATSSALKAGTIRLSNSIASTWTKVTNPATFVFSLTREIRQTAERLAFSKPGSQSLRRVYDLANAGPNHRFMVLTDRGPLLVHNCQYQGAVAAFHKMAHTQDPPVKLSNAEARRIVTLWRDKNDGIVDAWKELQQGAIDACEHKGMVVPLLADRVRYVSDGKFLYCRLPSGRTLHYPSPSVRWRTRTIKDEYGDEIEINSLGVTYYGTDGGRWAPIDLYGGMQFNHIVQGFARDLLVEAMFAVEAAGYEIVMHTHDDLVCEVDEDFGSEESFAALMVHAARKMAPGLPVAVKAWEGERWLK